MCASKTRSVTPKKLRSPVTIDVVLKGDQRLAENVILEVRAIAERHGLEIPNVRVVRRHVVGPKLAKSEARRTRESKARRKSSF